ncbi:MAG: hypothetical protein HFJ59_04395 [Clostridia bacterium]|nr:hypothetical protein [Clostridia bacterium]
MRIILWFLIGFICLALPLILTVFNIINLFKKKKIKENVIDIITFILGIILTITLYKFIGFKDYNKPIILDGLAVTAHAPISSWSMPTVVSILIVGIVSYFLIRIKKLDLSPLIIVSCMSGILICSIYIVVFIIQIFNISMIENLFYGIPFLALFPINYILCSIRAEIEIVNYYRQKNVRPKEYENKFLNKCNKILYDTNKWHILSIILALPLLIILICILTLFGQRPDEAIKAFLETSDWTLSREISPPPITYDGHYLCTVSLKGHERLVKPIRMGIRHGEKIVVNRQLCVANAFENLIEEKAPKFHKFVRYIYDKYGFPLSKHIHTSWQADITYILMKPLEWLFLLVLYIFDKKPENRITTQYIGKKDIMEEIK